MKISYECSELIEELKKDIEEFGDIMMYAFFEKIGDCIFLVNYDFIEEEKPLQPEELKDTMVQTLKASEILKILEEQNSFI